MSETREVASKVARWLVGKERPEDAVGVLVAWASHGPNDASGQALLAEALRIDPSAISAQQAFERMEGLEGAHSELKAALSTFDEQKIDQLKKEMESPTFRRAQIGFNNNIRAKDQVFHIQTEDSGLNSPHVITHLFADGGRVVKSHKRSYAEAVAMEADIGGYVRKLMKAQHLEMVFALRKGDFDEILAGRAVGGLQEIETYPEVDLTKLGRGGAKPPAPEADQAPSPAPEPVASAAPGARAQPDPASSAIPIAAPAPEPSSGRKPETSPPPASTRYSLSPDALASLPPTRIPLSARTGIGIPKAPKRAISRAAQPAVKPRGPVARPSKAGRLPLPSPRHAAAASAPALFALHVLRSMGGGPGRYSVAKRETVIGGSGDITLPGELFCHPREASLTFDRGRLWLDALEGENGVFLRIHKPVVVQFGEEFIVGDQLLRLEDNPVSDDAPDPAPTYFYSSPRWPSAFRLVQVFERGSKGACLVARGTALQVGSVIGDLILGDDPLVEPQHCVVEEQAGALILTDLDSKNGVFLRTRGRQELINGDEIVIGRTHLVVAIPPAIGA